MNADLTCCRRLARARPFARPRRRRRRDHAARRRGFGRARLPGRTHRRRRLAEATAANLFVMCERGAVLDRLAAMEKAGAVVVNSPAAIRNTYRHRMVELFARHHVPAPVSWVVATDANKPRPADCAWVKRYDFHATQRDDVMYAASETGWREALRRFAERGIPFVVAQEHVRGRPDQVLRRQERRGDRNADWFEWFYHRDKGMLGHAFDPARLQQGRARRRRGAWARGFRRRRHHSGQRRADDHRPQRLAELCALPRSRRQAIADCLSRALPAAPAPCRLSKELIR